MSKNTPPTGEVSLSRRRLFGLKRKDSESTIESMPRKIAVINPLTCLAYHKIVCYTCKDICREYISFQGLFFPEISADCTACGKCLNLCPQDSIALQDAPIQDTPADTAVETNP